MARRVDPIMDAVDRDPRLRAIPLASQMLWVRLMLALRATGDVCLRLGSAVPNPRELSLMVGVCEPDLETYLKPIIDAGLLEVQAGGLLALVEGVRSSKRAEASRANGLKGGRPRKEGSRPQASQSAFMLSIAGGTGHSETQQSADADDVGSTAKLKLSKSTAKQAKPDADARRIGLAALAEAGLPEDGQTGIVRSWLNGGATEGVILSTIAAKRRSGINHLGYFTKAIAEAALRPPSPAELGARSRAFDAAMQAWCEGGKVGGMPAPTWFDEQGRRVAA